MSQIKHPQIQNQLPNPKQESLKGVQQIHNQKDPSLSHSKKEKSKNHQVQIANSIKNKNISNIISSIKNQQNHQSCLAEQRKKQLSLHQIMKNNTSRSLIEGNHIQLQQINWDTAYVDQKYYLSDPASLTKLRQLQTQIQVEKQKLANNIQHTQYVEKSYYSHDQYSDQNQESIDNEQNLLESMTQANQSKLYQKKKIAQKQLENEQQKYRSKLEQMKKKKLHIKQTKEHQQIINIDPNQKKLQVNESQIKRQQMNNKKQQSIKQKSYTRKQINQNSQNLQNMNKQQNLVQLNQSKTPSKKSNKISQKLQKSNKNIQNTLKSIRSQVQTNKNKKSQQISPSEKKYQNSVKNDVQQEKISEKMIEIKTQKNKSVVNSRNSHSKKKTHQHIQKSLKNQCNQIFTKQENMSEAKKQNSLKKIQIKQDNKSKASQQRLSKRQQIMQKISNSNKQISNKSEKDNKIIENKLIIDDKKVEILKLQQITPKINSSLPTNQLKKIDKSVQWQSVSLASKTENKTNKNNQVNIRDERSIKHEEKNNSIIGSKNQKQSRIQHNQSQLQIKQRVHESQKSSNYQKKSQSEQCISYKQSEKKQASFKIHQRETSNKKSISRHSRNNSNQRYSVQQRQSKIEQNTKNQNKIYFPSRLSHRSDSQQKNNQAEIQKLHHQISQLQQKLKRVEKKQESMINFQNNQHKVMKQLSQSQGSGSEAASPLAKFQSPTRFKAQSKLSLESTVQFNAFQWKNMKSTQENQKLEKLRLQEQIGRLRKIIRQMQMEKIKAIDPNQVNQINSQYEQNMETSKVQLKRPSIPQLLQKSKIQLKKPLSIHIPQINNQQRIQQIKKQPPSPIRQLKSLNFSRDIDESGKIRKNSPTKQIESPRKYNKANAERLQVFSQKVINEVEHEQTQEQFVNKSSNQNSNSYFTKSLNLAKSYVVSKIDKIEEGQKSFKQFVQTSRSPVKMHASNVEQYPKQIYKQIEPDIEEKTLIKHSFSNNISNFSSKKITINRNNYSQILDHLKSQNPQDLNVMTPQIKIGDIHPPKLPSSPNLAMNQQNLLQLAKKTYKLFGIDVDSDQNQLCMKKYKNCIVFTFGHDQKNAIVWHYSGKFYYGGWRNTNEQSEGQKIGEGLQFVPGKHLYKGQFLQSKKNGSGIIKFDNGNIYEGQWVEGLKSGRGVYFQASTGIYYSGQWKQNKRDGFGILKFSDKQFYQGAFSQSVKHGYGVQRFSNGDIYKGEYINGKFHGKGKYIWFNGSSYEGDFVEGSRHGQGIWKSAKKGGDIYIGSYENDKKCGHGRYLWANGSIYQGEFKNDAKSGKGKLIYQDGKQVSGAWRQGNYMTDVERNRKHQDQPDQPLKKFGRATSLNPVLASPRRVQNF